MQPDQPLDQVFADPQVKARDMVVRMDHPAAPAPIALLANPIKYSATPVEYRRCRRQPSASTPTRFCGRCSALTDDEIAALRTSGVI